MFSKYATMCSDRICTEVKKREMAMTPKNVHSRAYHGARKDAIKRGLSDDLAKDIAHHLNNTTKSHPVDHTLATKVHEHTTI